MEKEIQITEQFIFNIILSLDEVDDGKKLTFLTRNDVSNCIDSFKSDILKLWLNESLTEPVIQTPLNQHDENLVETSPNITVIADSNLISSPNAAVSIIDQKTNVIAKQKEYNLILPNAKCGVKYTHTIDPGLLDCNTDEQIEVLGLENTGVIFDSTSKSFFGIPVISGTILIEVRFIDVTNNTQSIKSKLFINPDPKTLWKDIPTPIEIEYYKPDRDNCFVSVELQSNDSIINTSATKSIFAASARGRSHATEGKPRDDDFGIRFNFESQWYILSVADGAGSAKSSRKGSEIATKSVVEVCEYLISSNLELFENSINDFSLDSNDLNRKKLGDLLYNIIGNAVFKAFKNIEEEAKLSNKPLKEFSTTLIVSICKKFNFGWFVGAFWVGDGGVGIYNKEPQFLKILGEPDGGEYAGQTRFLTMPEITQPAEIYRRLRFEIVDDFTSLILMTDGVSDPKFESDANLFKIEKWNELWQELSDEVDFSNKNNTLSDQLLNWLDFWSPGNHDDRTIAILF